MWSRPDHELHIGTAYVSDRLLDRAQCGPRVPEAPSYKQKETKPFQMGTGAKKGGPVAKARFQTS